MSRIRSLAALVVFAAAVAAAATFGARFLPGAWYAGLDKAPWNPPGWVFGPVWSVLYVAIAAAGWRVWRAAGGGWSRALGLWLVQLALNAAWSWLFFGLHASGPALADITLLLAVIVAFAAAAWRLDRPAAWLFVPYAAWVAFATSLNLWIWLRNPGTA